MKKYFVTAAVLIAGVAGTICYNHESDSQMSELAKKNVKALALDGIEIGPLCITDEWPICHVFYDENPPLVIFGHHAEI